MLSQPWYFDINRIRQVCERIASRTSYDNLHDKMDYVTMELWRKEELYCHRERMLVNGCDKESCSICRPNH